MTPDPVADYLAAVPSPSVDHDDQWWDGYARGFDAAAHPTIGAVRRIRGQVTTNDPQADLLRAVAVEVESLRRALARGARPDEMRTRALRLARVCEGEQRGAL